MDLITTSTDTHRSTLPNTDEQIEMFEGEQKDVSQDMSVAQFMEFMTENYNLGSVTKALQIAAFMLCCDVISQDIAKSTLRLRERLDNGTSRIVNPTKHPLAGLLALEPNRRHSWMQYNEMTVLWSCLTSNSYSAIFRDNVGNPLEIIPLQTGRVFEKVAGREVFYDVTAGTMQEQALLGQTFMTFAERDMIHVRKRMLDGMDGYSTLDVGRRTLDTTAQLEAYRTKLFGNEGEMRGVFQRDTPGAMDDLAFGRLRSQLKYLMSRFKEGTQPIVLEDGIKFQPISSKPAEMELSEQFEAQLNEVCRLLRVPPHKIFLMTGTKYENLETQEKMYLGDTLIPVAKHHEQSMERALLSRADRLKYFLEYDRNEMTLHDTKLETDRAIRALERGAIEVDEARAVFGYNPLAGGAGQVRLVPVNMVVVNRKNEVVIGASSAPTDPAADPAQDDANTEDQPAADQTKSAPVLRIINN